MWKGSDPFSGKNVLETALRAKSKMKAPEPFFDKRILSRSHFNRTNAEVKEEILGKGVADFTYESIAPSYPEPW